jgi:Flp pilus assembly protein CpaB
MPKNKGVVKIVAKKNMSMIVSLGLAILAAVLVFIFVNSMKPTVPVVVAQKNLSVGKEIAREDVAIKKYPSSVVDSSTAKGLNEVVGKTVSFGPILQGETVRAEHLASTSSLMSALRSFAPGGWSAVELPPDTSLGMKGLRRGDVVNVYGEVAEGETAVVKHIADAVVLNVPETDPENSETQQFIIAVPEEAVPVVAGIAVRQQKAAVVLPEKGSE